jgi:hypothetical protein
LNVYLITDQVLLMGLLTAADATNEHSALSNIRVTAIDATGLCVDKVFIEFNGDFDFLNLIVGSLLLLDEGGFLHCVY